ncbi:MAG: type II toxin-antitoxin system RelE/ParE family toxin [Oscillospiraceae bacterium]|nr:type II toxin-antitoxin system RelE/ParE family toxin [Oscillospiraceae bacterium]
MEHKEYHVIVSDRAASELRNHVRFLARVSPDAAKRLHKEIIDEIKTLSFMPERYPWVIQDEIPKNKYRKKIVSKRYLLIFQIRDDKVYIDYILDCRQDYTWLL